MRDDDPIESILVAILLGKTKEQFGNLTPELNDFWDETAIAVKKIQDIGGVVALPSELD
jgi:hypothetical protein